MISKSGFDWRWSWIGLLSVVCLVNGSPVENQNQGLISIREWSPRQTQMAFEPSNQFSLKKRNFMPPKLQLKKCNGKQNLVDDFSIISYFLGAFSTFVGFGLDLIFSFTGNLIAIAATILSFLFGLPSSTITALNIANPFTYWFSNGLNVLSIATIWFAATSLDIGNLGLLTDLAFEILGIYSLVLSTFSTWPILFDELVDLGHLFGVGHHIKEFIDNYGCHNPYFREYY